jgi:hypothetical protein
MNSDRAVLEGWFGQDEGGAHDRLALHRLRHFLLPAPVTLLPQPGL